MLNKQSYKLSQNFMTFNKLSSFRKPIMFDFSTNVNPNYNDSDTNDIFNFEINTEYGEQTLSSNKNKTLLEFETDLKKELQVNNIEFRRWDHSFIAKGNHLKQVLKDITFIKINKMEWQILVIKSEEEENQEEVENLDLIGKGFAQHISEEKHLISDNIMTIYKSLKSFMKADDLTYNMLLYDTALQLYSIQTFHYNMVNDKLLDPKDPAGFQNLLNKYYELKSEYSRLLLEEKKVVRSCSRKTKALILLGGLFFVIQLFLIFYMTFVKYSWDITEPMTYLTGCINILIVCLLKYKFKQQSAFQYFNLKFLKRTKFYKNDFSKIAKIKDEISRIENKLN